MSIDLSSIPFIRVYIDETGDRGFGCSASKIFGFCAVLVSDETDPELRAAVDRLRRDFKIETGNPIHWVEHLRLKNHDRRRHAAKILTGIPGIKLIFVVIDKENVPAHSNLRRDIAAMYNYATRILFERIAFAAQEWDGGTRRAIIKVAHVRGHDHAATIDYVRNVCPRISSSVSVPWPLVSEKIGIAGQAAYDGLQAADIYAGMFNAAISPDRFGNCSPEYLLTCGHQIRRGPSGTILHYGIKVLGDVTTVTHREWWSQLEH